MHSICCTVCFVCVRVCVRYCMLGNMFNMHCSGFHLLQYLSRELNVRIERKSCNDRRDSRRQKRQHHSQSEIIEINVTVDFLSLLPHVSSKE